jgi:hypothetical protein
MVSTINWDNFFQIKQILFLAGFTETEQWGRRGIQLNIKIPNYKIYKLQHVNIYYMARFISQTMVYYPIITSKWG